MAGDNAPVHDAAQHAPVRGHQRAGTMGLGVKTTPVPGAYGVCIATDTEGVCHDDAAMGGDYDYN